MVDGKLKDSWTLLRVIDRVCYVVSPIAVRRIDVLLATCAGNLIVPAYVFHEFSNVGCVPGAIRSRSRQVSPSTARRPDAARYHARYRLRLPGTIRYYQMLSDTRYRTSEVARQR